MERLLKMYYLGSFFPFTLRYIFSSFPIKGRLERVLYGERTSLNEKIFCEMISASHSRKGIDKLCVFRSIHIGEYGLETRAASESLQKFRFRHFRVIETDGVAGEKTKEIKI